MKCDGTAALHTIPK